MPDVYQITYISQSSPYDELSRYISLSGKDGLEIGGNSNCVAATPFIRAGARSVVVSGLHDVDTESAPPDPKIRLEEADALQLVQKFGPDSFDFIYGVSILEHIPTPKNLFKEVYTILRPGGVAYLQGSPLWASAHGHHIWLSSWVAGTKKTYYFIPYPGAGSYNPIPDWGHLLHSPEELAKLLPEQGVPVEDIPIVIKAIYENPGLNKESATSIMTAASTSDLVILNAFVHRHVIPEPVLTSLRQIFPSKTEDWSIHGVALVLQKPTDAEILPAVHSPK